MRTTSDRSETAKLIGIGALTGLVGAMTTSLRMTKFPPTVAVSTFVGGMAGFFLAGDVRLSMLTAFFPPLFLFFLSKI